MEEQMTKVKLIELIEVQRHSLDQTLTRLEESQMTIPGVESDWSVKDILVHISAWERKMCQWLEECADGKVPQRPAPGHTWDDLDKVNLQIYEQNKDKSPDEVLFEFHDSYQESLEIVKAFPEDDLIDPDRFEWRESDPLWHMVGGNTFWHYEEHENSIRKWTKEQ
jgi:hypothetical protein